MPERWAGRGGLPDAVCQITIEQQHGFVHAGAVAAIADSAAGYAAATTMRPGTGVLTTEFKINLTAPAAGDRLIARGRVIKAGRTAIFTEVEVFDDRQRLIARGSVTFVIAARRAPETPPA